MATVKQLPAAYANITITVANLASDTNLLAGRSCTVVDNTSNLYVDALLDGFITTGTTPTVSTSIEIWVWSILDDVPTYPDTVTGSDANTTLTSTNVKTVGFALGTVITVDATSNRKYPIRPFSVAQLFGGIMPKKWGVFIVQNTGAALNATGGNHQISYAGIQYSIV